MNVSIFTPLVVVATFLVLLAVVAALVLGNPEASKRRVLALFRRKPKAPRGPGPDHYYRPYWS